MQKDEDGSLGEPVIDDPDFEDDAYLTPTTPPPESPTVTATKSVSIRAPPRHRPCTLMSMLKITMCRC